MAFYMDLFISLIYFIVVSLLVYQTVFKMKIRNKKTVLVFTSFIGVSGLYHFVLFGNHFFDLKTAAQTVKLAKMALSVVCIYYSWPFIKQALMNQTIQEEELKERDIKIFKDAYVHSMVGMALLDNKGHFIKANHEFVSLLGFDSEDDLNEINFKDIISAEEDIDDLRKKVADADSFLEINNLRLTRADGKELWVDLSTSVMRDSKGEIDFCSCQLFDKTELIRTTEELEKQRISSIERNRSTYLEEMGRSIAHEINNPLTIISGSAQIGLIKIKTNKIDIDKMKKQFLDITEATKRVSDIIERLRFLSTEQEGEKEHHFHAKELEDTVGDLLQERFSRANIEFSFVANDIEQVEVPYDLSVVSRIIVDLLMNTIEKDYGDISAKVSVSAFKTMNSFIFEISDNGKCIDEEILGKIFLPFFTTKTGRRNVGLGLSYAKNVLNSLDGDIEYCSKERSMFRIKLPILAEKKRAA